MADNDLIDALGQKDFSRFDDIINSTLDQKIADVQEEFQKDVAETMMSEAMGLEVTNEEADIERIKGVLMTYGGSDIHELEGVVTAEYSTLAAAVDAMKRVEIISFVDTVEVDHVLTGPDTNSSDLLDDSTVIKTYEVYVYLDSDFTSFDDFPEDEESINEETEIQELNEEELLEIKRLIKINSKGKKRIKFKCAKGFAFDSARRVCRKISGKAKVNKRRGIKKALITKKSKGAGLKRRTLKKTRRALRKRKAFGLSRRRR